jgi:hypothetical protein
MCIIISNWGAKTIEEDILKNSWYNNDDGAGIVYLNHDRLFVQKGIMTFQDFLDVYDKVRMFPHVIHFRIGTSGMDARGCTHPFPITKNHNVLNTCSYSTNGIVLAHNGILGQGEGVLSDTQVFVRDFMYPLCKVVGDKIMSNNKYVKDLIESQLKGTSRIILVHPKFGARIFGKGWIEEDGIFYSNRSFSYSFMLDFSKSDKFGFCECSICGDLYRERDWDRYLFRMDADELSELDTIFDEVCPKCYYDMVDTPTKWEDKP